MKTSAMLATLFVSAAFATVAAAEPLTVGADATIEKLLTSQIGKSVTVRTGGAEEITGKVKSVSSELVHLSELSGKEFFDAVVTTDSITSVVIRTR
jgi:hypothetical protein